jgi:hypothetical protein
MMRSILFLISLSSFLSVAAQKQKVLNKVEAHLAKENSQWYDGNIQLWEDVEKIPGSIRFNDKTQVLTFKLDEGEPEILKPSEVKRFEFFDTERKLVRSFISIEYPIIEGVISEQKAQNNFETTSNQSPSTSPTFFEIINQTKYFSLLSKTSKLQTIDQIERNWAHITRIMVYQNPSNVNINKGRYNNLGQEITFFIFGVDGKLRPAIRLTKIETKNSTKDANDRWSYKYDKNPDIDLDEKLLSQMMDVYFPRVKEYMIANKLDKNKIEDLIKIVEHFKQLEDAQ